MKTSGKTAKDVGGVATSVRNVLSGGGPGSITFWGVDLGFIGGSVLEYEVNARGIHKSENETDVSVEEGRDLMMCGIR